MFTFRNFLLILLILIGAIGIGVFFFYSYRAPSKTTRIESMPDIPTPTPTPEPQKSTTSWISSDGSKILVMESLQTSSGSTNYSFFVTPLATQSGQLIFVHTSEPEASMSIPFNTWSPDNKYFFIQEHTATETATLVFKASGEKFPDEKSFLDINTLFAEKNNDFALAEVTGWAAPALLLVNTRTADQASTGPSFWFDISRKSIIRLSTLFQ